MNYLSKKCMADTMIRDDNYYSSTYFTQIYPFTTENINGYLPLFDLNNKTLLTVGSSGDQVLNAVISGCKEIDVIDLCPFSQEYFNLKRAAIEVLTRNEFLDFFCYRNYPNRYIYNDKAFSPEFYFKIREVLKDISYEDFYFWDMLFAEYGGLEIRKSLLKMDESILTVLVSVNQYLYSDEEYLKLRNMLENVMVNFSIGNIFNIELTKNYDNIFLSNIASYNSIGKMKKLFDELLPYLNDDGRILIAYLYQAGIDSCLNKKWSLFGDIDISSFVGVRGIINGTEEIEDSVITYRKVRK